MDSVVVRYVDACSNDLLVVMTDAAPICVGNLLPVCYFEGQMRVLFVLYLCSCLLPGCSDVSWLWRLATRRWSGLNLLSLLKPGGGAPSGSVWI